MDSHLRLGLSKHARAHALRVSFCLSSGAKWMSTQSIKAFTATAFALVACSGMVVEHAISTRTFSKNRYPWVATGVLVIHRYIKQRQVTRPAIAKHSAMQNHIIDWEGATVLDMEDDWQAWKIKEALHISKQDPQLRAGDKQGRGLENQPNLARTIGIVVPLWLSITTHACVKCADEDARIKARAACVTCFVLELSLYTANNHLSDSFFFK